MSLIVVPSIDLRGGRVVRLQQGDYARQIDYEVDPVATARSFAAAGATWMHVVDLDGAKEGRPVQTEMISRLSAAAGVAVQAGGGIRQRQDIDRLLEAGVRRIVVGTKAMEDWPWFNSLAHEAKYAGRIVLAVDAKEGVIAVRGWTQTSSRSAVDVAKEVSDWPLAGILYTDVAKDGMLQGPNLQQTRAVAEAGKVPVIASGGVGSIEHIRQLKQLPVWGVIVGRSLYEGKVDLAEAIRAASE
ncbi:MAG TPA: 1-(5-phosphoribosyl)-5-[(5-phosphoribosylamino)methylideneamino]imidazole-4-carboxamide isomerase [Tepidisphaeraceae bacterium]|jgi:phosphoribosylformimino-5-aminoimidazole carboxamide ribotide isomerase|nr:1-(5-phosphoribosyl)-5-[(5-phosphoribosylamino)methylideneamino]imidazole-4-carboxamide isomerase [Tepidisphaeraceae bacterium]